MNTSPERHNRVLSISARSPRSQAPQHPRSSTLQLASTRRELGWHAASPPPTRLQPPLRGIREQQFESSIHEMIGPSSCLRAPPRTLQRQLRNELGLLPVRDRTDDVPRTYWFPLEPPNPGFGCHIMATVSHNWRESKPLPSAGCSHRMPRQRVTTGLGCGTQLGHFHWLQTFKNSSPATYPPLISSPRAHTTRAVIRSSEPASGNITTLSSGESGKLIRILIPWSDPSIVKALCCLW